jgi:hypothetical protein
MGLAEVLGFRRARGGAVRTERNGNRRPHQVHDARPGRTNGQIEKQLPGIVGRRKDDVRIEVRNLLGKEDPHLGIAGKDPDIHSVQLHANHARAGRIRFYASFRKLAKQFLVIRIAEAFNPGYHANLVPAGSQRFHQ